MEITKKPDLEKLKAKRAAARDAYYTARAALDAAAARATRAALAAQAKEQDA